MRFHYVLMLLLCCSGCAKMDDYHDSPRRDQLIGNQWRIISEQYDGMERLAACRLDDVWTFDRSGYVKEAANHLKCDPAQPDHSVYDYVLLDEEQELHLSAFNGAPHRFRISTWNDTLFTLTETDPGNDAEQVSLTLSRR